jgi:acetyltransferase-like isoleucine patch superfamily enzyme
MGSAPAFVGVMDIDFQSLDSADGFLREDCEENWRAVFVRVGSGVFVGMSAAILNGVSVGDQVVIGTSLVMVKVVPAGAVVAGNPGMVIAALPKSES